MPPPARATLSGEEGGEPTGAAMVRVKARRTKETAAAGEYPYVDEEHAERDAVAVCCRQVSAQQAVCQCLHFVDEEHDEE